MTAREKLEAAADTCVDELNECTRELRRLRERLTALLERERELNVAIKAAEKEPS